MSVKKEEFIKKLPQKTGVYKFLDSQIRLFMLVKQKILEKGFCPISAQKQVEKH